MPSERAAATASFHVGPLTVRIDGEHPCTTWAAGAFPAAPQPADAAHAADLHFHFGRSLRADFPAPSIRTKTATLAPGLVHFRDRRLDWSVEAAPPADRPDAALHVRLHDCTPPTEWRRTLADPDEAWKMWLTHGAPPSLHIIKDFVYRIQLPVTLLALLQRNAAFIHAGAVAVGERAVLLPGWGGVGKSTVMTRAVLHGRGRFLADDHAILTADGRIHPHLLPMHIYAYHMQADAALRRHVLAACTPAERRQWALARRIRPSKAVRWVSPANVFGRDRIAPASILEEILLLARVDAADFSATPCPPARAAGIAAGIMHQEFPHLLGQLAAAQAADFNTPLPSVTDYDTALRRTYTAAFADHRCTQILIPRRATPEDLVAFLRRHSPLLDDAMHN